MMESGRTGTSASVEVEFMMDDKEEVAQKNGESVNVEYMFETLTHCDQKYKREMGVNEMPVSRYTSNSTRGIITKGGRRKKNKSSINRINDSSLFTILWGPL
jgi:hypothetical protein